MAFLLDTNVLSELRKAGRCDDGVAAWFRSTAATDLFTSVIVVGEIRRGVESLRRRDPASAQHLDRWLRSVVATFNHRILGVDLAVAERWGILTAGSALPLEDALIAASALHHGLTLVTRNTRDVRRTGVATLNPWSFEDGSGKVRKSAADE